MPITSLKLPAWVLAAGLGLLASSGGGRADPSFDCSRASQPDEIAICSDPQLAKLDTLVAARYAQVTMMYQSKEEVGRAVLRDRQSCGSDRICIAAVQIAALQEYGEDVPDWAQNLVDAGFAKKAEIAAEQLSGFAKHVPAQTGDCVKTRLTGVYVQINRPLTAANADQGVVSTDYENGGFAYGYGGGVGFVGAKVGQPVIQCLMSRRYDCPAGDDRGRIYYSLDLATKGSWIAPDAEHGCGGA